MRAPPRGVGDASGVCDVGGVGYVSGVGGVWALEDVVSEYYVPTWEQDGVTISEVTPLTHPEEDYEVVTFEVTGTTTTFYQDGTPVPVRHTVVVIRDGVFECAIDLLRFGATDPASTQRWDPELTSIVDSFRFKKDVE